jgi:hypothetical protein
MTIMLWPYAFGFPQFLHIDVVNEPVDDTVGERGMAYRFVPTRDRQL